MTHPKLELIGVNYAAMVGDMLAILSSLDDAGVLGPDDHDDIRSGGGGSRRPHTPSPRFRVCHEFPLYFYRPDRVSLRLTLGCAEYFATRAKANALDFQASVADAMQESPEEGLATVNAQAELDSELVASLYQILKDVGRCLRTAIRKRGARTGGTNGLATSESVSRRRVASVGGTDDDDKRALQLGWWMLKMLNLCSDTQDAVDQALMSAQRDEQLPRTSASASTHRLPRPLHRNRFSGSGSMFEGSGSSASAAGLTGDSWFPKEEIENLACWFLAHTPDGEVSFLVPTRRKRQIPCLLSCPSQIKI